MLFAEGIFLGGIHNFSLGQWTPESDHRMLCLDLKCMEGLEKLRAIVEAQQVHVNINFEKAHMYNEMVENM